MTSAHERISNETENAKIITRYRDDFFSVQEERILDSKEISTLRVLDLSFDQKIGNADLKLLENATDLLELNLSHCSGIDNDGLIFLKNLTKLEILNLSGCNINDIGLDFLRPLKNLRHLDLRGCLKINGFGLIGLKDLPLESISLPNRIFDQNKVEFLSCCKNLRRWSDLTHEVTLPMLKVLGSFSQLRELELRHCEKVREDDLSYLKNLAELESLRLFNVNKLTGESFKVLGAFEKLKILSINDNPNITSEVIGYLSFPAELEELDLRDCPRINEDLLTKLPVMARLKVLKTDSFKISAEKRREIESILPECRFDNSYIRPPGVLKKLLLLGVAIFSALYLIALVFAAFYIILFSGMTIHHYYGWLGVLAAIIAIPAMAWGWGMSFRIYRSLRRSRAE